MNQPNILFIGFGDLARRTVKQMVQEGLGSTAAGMPSITGLRRSNAHHPAVNMRAGDATQKSMIRDLLAGQPDQIVITLTPDQYSREGYERAYLQPVTILIEVATQLGCRAHIQFVSSTSVYGQDAGEWIDEQSPCQPSRYSGQVIREAEQRLLDSPLNTTIVRFGGIYRSGSYRLIERVRAKGVVPAYPVSWTNRIHADDAARILLHLMTQPVQSHPIYIGTDNCPCPAHEIQSWIQAELRQHNILPPTVQLDSNPEEFGSKGKRCRNNKLINSGFELRYPSYKEGYSELIRDYLAA